MGEKKKKWKTKSNNKIFVLWCFVITVLWWENAAVITWSLWLIYWRVAAVGVGSWPYILLLQCVPSYGCTASSVRELLWKELKTIKKKKKKRRFQRDLFQGPAFCPFAQRSAPAQDWEQKHVTRDGRQVVPKGSIQQLLSTVATLKVQSDMCILVLTTQ